MLNDNVFVNNRKKAIKAIKIIIKNCNIFFVIYYSIDFISLKNITRIKLLSKK